jgi:peptidoglycan/LPS O-acetylase OafA/YrhL
LTSVTRAALTPTPVHRDRIQIVDSLRGVAALSVAWFHFTYGGALLANGWLKSSGEFGWVGVDIFFVISGFIIPYTMSLRGYTLRRDFGTFILKRVIRLDPPYLVTIVITIVLGYVSAMMPGFRGTPPRFPAPQVFSHLAYLNSFLGYEWLSPVFWSLAIEFQFYLLVAIAFPIVFHRLAACRSGVLLIACALSVALPWPNLVFQYLALFALGAATSQFRSGLSSPRLYAVLLSAAALATAIALGTIVAIVGVAAALLIAFVRSGRYRVLTYTGSVSYSLYLLHVPIGGRIVNLGTRFAHTLPLQIAVLGAALCGSLVAAYAVYRMVELPAQRWSSAITYRGAQRPARPIMGSFPGT